MIPITTPALRAHQRLLESLRPRTHVRVEPTAGVPWAPDADASAEGLRRARRARMDQALEKRERVLELAAQGKTNKEIEALLHFSSATVSRHRRGVGLRIYQRGEAARS